MLSPGQESHLESLRASRDGDPLAVCRSAKQRHDSLKGQVILDFAPTRRFPDALPPGVGMRPVILCEFTHAMGNATGNYAEWWELFRSLKHSQGGFIWAWADEALPKVDRSGKPYWAYGGDFGEAVHNFTFCLNGAARARQTHLSHQGLVGIA